jgi:aminopeptidase-like protein
MMPEAGVKLHKHIENLFPICRSITGEGLRATLHYIADHIPLNVTESPTGTRVLDWTVPPEWSIRGASLKTLEGRTVVDFSQNNLHVINYSVPFNGVVTRPDLEPHLHSCPDEPDLIPYVTSYYKRDWGFCLAHHDRIALTAYRVDIDTSLSDGSLSYGECVLPGEESDEVLISAHCCHPSLANDNLSSIAIAIELALRLSACRRRFTWRFLFAPGTIGAISWLASNPDVLDRVRHGLVLTCLGDLGPPTYKRSRQSDALIDRYLAHLMQRDGHGDRIVPFQPTGYDERQFCSPGFNLPVGCVMRSPGGTFREYHTSADNLGFVKPDALADSLSLLSEAAELIERNRVYRSTMPYGEPHFASRGLELVDDRIAMLWVLNMADGLNSLLDVAERSGIAFNAIARAAERLMSAGLLEPQ